MDKGTVSEEKTDFYKELFKGSMISPVTPLYQQAASGRGDAIRLRTLQHMNVMHLQKLLADEVAVMLRQQSTDREQMDLLRELLSQYTSALKDLKFMLERTSQDELTSKFMSDLFFVNATRDSAILAHAGVPAEMRSKEHLEPAPLRVSEYTGYAGKIHSEAKRLESFVAFLYRARAAMTICVALIGPMLIMRLHNTLVTQLVTSSVFIIAWAALVCYCGEGESEMDVAMASASYAAVLVVFVGVSGSRSPSHPVFTPQSFTVARIPRHSQPRSAVTSTLLRYIFPQTRQRARDQLRHWRLNHLPHLKHATQARIYRYLVQRQARRQQRLLTKSPTLRALIQQKGALFGRAQHFRNALSRPWPNMTQELGYGSGGGGEGSKRSKLRGYLRAANELRQTYTQQYAPAWNQRGSNPEDLQDGTPGSYPHAAVITSGNEQMILFPSYARKHVKTKPKPRPGTVQETAGQGRDARDGPGAGDADFMKQQWEEYEEDNAVVDVDVRGWVFSPQKGQMTRKQRLLVTLAKQLAGLPSATTTTPPTASPSASRQPSPHTQRVEERRQRHEELEASKQAEEILRKGEAEADAAGKGQYSEAPRDGGEQRRPRHGRNLSPGGGLRRLAATQAANQDDDPANITPAQKRSSWNQPAEMTSEELATANAHLMARLAPFMSNPLANAPISAFFYNDDHSRQRTIYTTAYGHFALRAALDFVPTHVRILAAENLSATEEVIITPERGVSLISDIDDTIKHSAITTGAREIFRNAFIRDLGDLNVDGVPAWYKKLADMGVKFHYVSNSPWQLYPVISKFFEMSGLPPGSFHLKQYSGMLQGIFEPVAERKKGTLDRIAADFPERRFILVGDSGEADLEVYLDFVSENPGRVLAIMIRDVTTPHHHGFFSPSTAAPGGGRTARMPEVRSSAMGPNRAIDDDDDQELKAAIAASLQSLKEEEEGRGRPPLPARRPTGDVKTQRRGETAPSEDLIDLGDPDLSRTPSIQAPNSGLGLPPALKRSDLVGSTTKAPPPTIPRKPVTLKAKAVPTPNGEILKKAPPPPPPSRRSAACDLSTEKMDSTAESISAEQSVSVMDRPPISRQSSAATTATNASNSGATTSTTTSGYSYREAARQKLSSAYNALPAAPWNSSYVHTELTRTPGDSAANSQNTTYSSAAANRISGALSSYNNPGRQSEPEQTASRNHLTANSTSNPRNNGLNSNGVPANRRLELWQQRWERAQWYCKEKGVVLRSWRVGSDVAEECAKLVGKSLKEMDLEESGKERE